MRKNKIRRYHFVALFFSIRAIFRQNLGDEIKYKGEKHLIQNGTRPNQWKIGYNPDNSEWWVNRSECKKVISPENIRHSFTFMWNFYKTNWFSIWEQDKGISNFSRGCSIWGGWKWKPRKEQDS